MTDLRNPTILLFDSGIGGLSVVKEARIILPAFRYVYVADNAAFPYGAWNEEALVKRIVDLFGQLLPRFEPGIVVIGCNTASTIGISALREAYPDYVFVGTVPAVKPAAERTVSGLVSVLATPGTVKRQYTRDLIQKYAQKCHVRLVGSERLAALAETYMRTGFVDEDAVRKEIDPCFMDVEGKRTDIVVLACTHYPFLANRMRKVAPWPVDWIDTSEAIARRALTLVNTMQFGPIQQEMRDIALFTSDEMPSDLVHLVKGFGLRAEDKSAHGLAL